MKNIFWLCMFTASAFFAACGSKTTEVVYTNDGKPGTIIIDVTLFDSVIMVGGGSTRITDASGVEVSLEGTSLKEITDINGRCNISNVPPGAYDFLFTKDGFGIMKGGPFEFAGNGTDFYSGVLHRMSHRTPELVLRPFSNEGVAQFTFKIVDPTQQEEYEWGFIYFSKNDKINADDTNSYQYSFFVYYDSPNATEVNAPIAKQDLLNAGFTENQQIFCVAYTGNISNYQDYYTHKIIYTGFSPYTSGVKSFLLP